MPHATIEKLLQKDMWWVQSLLCNSWVNTFRGKRIYATIDDICFLRSVPRSYKKDKEDRLSQPRVVAGSNTSTVTLQIVAGDEKGIIKSEAVKYGR
jgi:hypothetical protein